MGLAARAGALHRAGTADRKAARDALGLLGIESLGQQLFRNLSTGQQQRVLLARALAGGRMCSCSTNRPWGWTSPARRRCSNSCRDINRTRGVTILLVTHLLPIVLNLATSIMVMGAGTVLQGDTDDGAAGGQAHRVVRGAGASRGRGGPAHARGEQRLAAACLSPCSCGWRSSHPSSTGLALGVLGVYLVIRRIVFFGLVLANAATLGAAVAEAMGWPPALVSLAAGVGAAVALGDVDASSRVSNESLMGWAYAATAVGHRARARQRRGRERRHAEPAVRECPGRSAGQGDRAGGARGWPCAPVQLLFAQRFLLVTFDAQAAKVAGVNTHLWSLGLNLTIGAATAAAVYEIGALSTFALLALPSMSALLVTSSLRSTFLVAGALGAVVPALALAAAFYLDLPAGPACVALLASGVAVAALWNRASSRRGGA